MNLKKEIEDTFEIIGVTLSSPKQKTIAIISGLLIFGFLYYFLVANVADNDIWISVMMSGEGFITFSIVTILITSALSGILFSMIFFKFSSYHKMEGRGLFGFIGSGIAAFGVGCPTCGAFIFGLIGMPLALMYLPFRGLELQFLGIFILLASVYFTSKSIKGICKIK
jgi:hypothetical protein